MAFPTHVATEKFQRSANGTSTSIPEPSGLTANQRVIVLMGLDDNDTSGTTSQAGWTRQYFSSASDRLLVFHGVVGEIEWPLVVSHDSESTAGGVLVLDGADVPLFSSGATGSGSQPNPPSFTPAGGAKDYLWIAVYQEEDGAPLASGAPSGFTGLDTNSSSGSNTTGATSLGWAFKAENTATQDPGAFSGAATDDWVAITIAVPPAPTGPATFTGSGAVSAPTPPVVAAAGSFTKPTFSGPAAVSAPAPSAAAAGSFTKPNFTGSGDVQAPKPTLAGFGTSGQVFNGIGAVQAPPASVAAAGSHTKPTYSGAGALAAPKPTLAGAGAHTVRTGSGSLAAPKPTAAGAGSFTPRFSGDGALTAPQPGVAGAGRHQNAAGALSGPKPTTLGAGSFTKPSDVGAGALVGPAPVAAGVGSFAEYTAIIPIPSRSVMDSLYGDRITTYRWEVLEHSNGIDQLIGTLDGVADGKLSWTQYAAVKGGGKIEVTDLDQAAPGMIDISDLPLESIRLRPVQIIEGLPENPLGVYLISAAAEEWQATGRTWSIELLDRCTVPSQDKVEESYAVAAGTLILQEVKAILASCGEYIAVNDSVTIATSSGMVWEAGTSKLKIINDLLDVANYNALWMDGYGNFMTTPRVLPADRSINYEVLNIPRELKDGEQSIYEPDWKRDKDSFDVPNKVVAVQAAGGEDEEALIGVWTNEDPASPYSYVSRGRWIVHTLDSVETPEGTDLEVIAFLQARARATLIQMSAVQAQVKLTHLPVPVRVADVIRFAHTQAGIDSRHVVTKTDLELNPLGLMTSELQEVISL